MPSHAPYTSHAAWTHDRELCATRRQTARSAPQTRSRSSSVTPWRGIHAQSLAIPHQRNTRPAGPCVPTPSTKGEKQRSLSWGRAATPELALLPRSSGFPLFSSRPKSQILRRRQACHAVIRKIGLTEPAQWRESSSFPLIRLHKSPIPPGCQESLAAVRPIDFTEPAQSPAVSVFPTARTHRSHTAADAWCLPQRPPV
jgi:hypothetical protein